MSSSNVGVFNPKKRSVHDHDDDDKHDDYDGSTSPVIYRSLGDNNDVVVDDGSISSSSLSPNKHVKTMTNHLIDLTTTNNVIDLTTTNNIIDLTTNDDLTTSCTQDTTINLWNLTRSLCNNWRNCKGTADFAFGARNVCALFYFLKKLEGAPHEIFDAVDGINKTNKNENENEKKNKYADWFNYLGRFVALYVKPRNALGQSQRVAPSILETYVNGGGSGDDDDDADKGCERIVVLDGEAQGTEEWADKINAAAAAATDDKITKVVTAEALANPNLGAIAMAAEVIKRKFTVPFDGVHIDEPFKGMAGGVPGKCNMMYYGNPDDSIPKGNIVYDRFESCHVLFLPTKPTGTEAVSTTYLMYILPKRDVDGATDPADLAAAIDEVFANGRVLCDFLQDVFSSSSSSSSSSRRPSSSMASSSTIYAATVPRTKINMKPADITPMCTQHFESVCALDNIVQAQKYGADDDKSLPDDDAWAKERVEINLVQHATYLHIYESGFEAAAVTAAICYRSLWISKYYEPLIFNRGHALAIVDMNPNNPHILYFATQETDQGLKNAPDLPPPGEEE